MFVCPPGANMFNVIQKVSWAFELPIFYIKYFVSYIFYWQSTMTLIVTPEFEDVKHFPSFFFLFSWHIQELCVPFYVLIIYLFIYLFQFPLFNLLFRAKKKLHFSLNVYSLCRRLFYCFRAWQMVNWNNNGIKITTNVRKKEQQNEIDRNFLAGNCSFSLESVCV